jgi:serine protease Do
MVSRIPGRLLLALLAAACSRGEDASAQQPASPARQAISRTVDEQRRTALVDATARVAPAVVSVRVTLPRPQPTMFDRFYGQSPDAPQSFGTGFLLRQDGIVITNQHVVANAQQITITLADGTDLDGKLLGDDPLTDIAVIKVARTGLPVVKVGHSSDLMIGEWAIAIGNPYTYMLGNSEPSVTAGVISGTGRNILPTGEMNGEYLDMIQTDAAINPGNSGGPLVNALGEVVGVNSSIFSNTGESVGLGFAIPIERAVRVADEIIKNGSVRRAWVGLDVTGPSTMGDWKRTGGVTVRQVAPDGPAAKAGIHAGDVLLQADGKALRNYLDWQAVALDLHVGDSIAVSVRTATGTVTRRIFTGDIPNTRLQVAGIEVVTLTPAVRAQLKVQSTDGAAVTKIPEALTRQIGLQQGDVILAIGQTRITSAEDFRAVLESIRSGTVFRLVAERQGTRFYIDLQK